MWGTGPWLRGGFTSTTREGPGGFGGVGWGCGGVRLLVKPVFKWTCGRDWWHQRTEGCWDDKYCCGSFGPFLSQIWRWRRLSPREEKWSSRVSLCPHVFSESRWFSLAKNKDLISFETSEKQLSLPAACSQLGLFSNLWKCFLQQGFHNGGVWPHDLTRR